MPTYEKPTGGTADDEPVRGALDNASPVARQPRWLIPGAVAVCAAGVLVGALLATDVFGAGRDRDPGVVAHISAPATVRTSSQAVAAPQIRASSVTSPRATPGRPAPSGTTARSPRSVKLPPPEVWVLRSVASSRCLGVLTGPAEGADVAQQPCSGAASQQWRTERVQSAVVRLVNAASGKCLEVDGLSRSDNAVVQQRSCDGGPNQLWQVRDEQAGQVVLVVLHSGKCLQAWGSREVGQSKCDGADDQRWTTD